MLKTSINIHPISDHKRSSTVVTQQVQWSNNRLSVHSTRNDLDLPDSTNLSQIKTTVINLPVSHSSNHVQTDILLDRSFYRAPGIVSGLLKVRVKDSKTHVRDIIVELEGHEEAEDKILILKRSLVLQGKEAPPSEIVDPTVRDMAGFFAAKKGTVVLPFAIEVPSAPSSFTRKRCSVTYSIRCIMEIKSRKGVVSNYVVEQPLTIYQRQEDVGGVVPCSFAASERWGGFLTGRGQVKVQCDMESSQYASGSIAYAKVNVENLSKKRVESITLRLMERIKTFNFDEEGRLYPLSFQRNVLQEVKYDAKQFDFDLVPGRFSCLSLPLPTNTFDVKCKTVEVSHVIQVIASAGGIGKQITVYLPIELYHESTVSPPPRLELEDVRYFLKLDEIQASSPANYEDNRLSVATEPDQLERDGTVSVKPYFGTIGQDSGFISSKDLPVVPENVEENEKVLDEIAAELKKLQTPSVKPRPVSIYSNYSVPIITHHAVTTDTIAEEHEYVDENELAKESCQDVISGIIQQEQAIGDMFHDVLVRSEQN